MPFSDPASAVDCTAEGEHQIDISSRSSSVSAEAEGLRLYFTGWTLHLPTPTHPFVSRETAIPSCEARVDI